MVESERRVRPHFRRIDAKLATGDFRRQLSCRDDSLALRQGSEHLMEVSLFDHHEVFVGGRSCSTTDLGAGIKQCDTFFFEKGLEQIQPESLCLGIDKVVLVVEENDAEDPPHVIDEIRVIEWHRPPLLCRRKGAQHQDAGTFR